MNREKFFSTKMTKKSRHGSKVERWSTHQEIKDRKTGSKIRRK